MDLEDLQKHWNRFGEQDPLWAILTVPDRRYGRWDKDEFFQSGEREVQTVLERVERQAQRDGATLQRHRALDFGCGVGRLTQALASHFDTCDGVDIAPSMLAAAEKANQYGDRCRYHLNDRDDLSLFEDGSFDFIYTTHVLQHMEPRYSSRFITEFIRLLAPGGYAMFELATEPVVGATGPLPDDAFSARVSMAWHLTLAAGQRHVLPVTVTNSSPRTWPASGDKGWFMVTVGNHWSGRGGKMLQLDDGRAMLPHDVAPNQAVEVELEICAPTEPGLYHLEVDLVQEGVGWFGSHGSIRGASMVRVNRSPTSGRRWRAFRWTRHTTPAPAPDEGVDQVTSEPVMEMHGIAEPEVATLVSAAGGRIVEVFDWDEMNAIPSTDWHRRGFLATLRPE